MNEGTPLPGLCAVCVVKLRYSAPVKVRFPLEDECTVEAEDIRELVEDMASGRVPVVPVTLPGGDQLLMRPVTSVEGTLLCLHHATWAVRRKLADLM